MEVDFWNRKNNSMPKEKVLKNNWNDTNKQKYMYVENLEKRWRYEKRYRKKTEKIIKNKAKKENKNIYIKWYSLPGTNQNFEYLFWMPSYCRWFYKLFIHPFGFVTN